MKRAFVVILAIIQITSLFPAFAEPDYSNMTDEQLEQMIQNAQAELDSRGASADEAALEFDGMVSVREAGFQVKKGKWLYYSFIAHSNLTDKAIQYPEFRIVVRDSEGGLISSDSQVLNILYPGQDTMYGGMGMSVEGENPAIIEIEFVEPDGDWHFVDPTSTDYPNYEPIVIDSSRLKNDGNIVGELVNPNPYDIGNVAITVLFRDSDGKLLAGDTTFVDGAKSNTKIAFEIRGLKDIATEQYDLFAQPW